MIKKTAKGYTLYSKDGSRKLGGPYKTREEALRRERQVQFFKHVRKRATYGMRSTVLKKQSS